MFRSFITGIVAPCRPLMGVLPVMNFCSLWAVEGYPPREAAMPPVGLLVSCPLRRQPCFVQGLWWVILPVRQLCPLMDTTLMHITISALPLARPNCIGFNLQSCHLPDYFISFSLQPCHLPHFIAWISVCNAATVILLHWFQFISPAICQTLFTLTAVQLARLYFTGFSLQSCHSSDLTALVSVYSRATGQTLFHWFQLAVLPLAGFDLPRFSLQPAYIRATLQLCQRTEYTSPGPRCDLAGQNLFH